MLKSFRFGQSERQAFVQGREEWCAAAELLQLDR